MAGQQHAAGANHEGNLTDDDDRDYCGTDEDDAGYHTPGSRSTSLAGSPSVKKRHRDEKELYASRVERRFDIWTKARRQLEFVSSRHHVRELRP